MNTALTGATQPETFESALKARADTMADACTRCGKCVEVCPATEAAGLTVEEQPNPVEVIAGIVDIIKSRRRQRRRDASGRAGCLLSGECIKACDYGVNPRFLLYMARIALSHGKKDAAAERRSGFDAFRLVARDVPHIAKIQLDDALLARLGQGAQGKAARAAGEKPDFVFYTGCNVLKTPHIALHALDIMDALDITYDVMGGPTHCCGIVQMRMGDVTTSGRVGENTIDKLSQNNTGQVISWCPSEHATKAPT